MWPSPGDGDSHWAISRILGVSGAKAKLVKPGRSVVCALWAVGPFGVSPLHDINTGSSKFYLTILAKIQ